MPLITIFSPAERSDGIRDIIEDVRKRGADALECPPSNVWVIFSPVLANHYVQDGEEGKSGLVKSPIVIVRAQKGRTAKQKDAFVVAITSAIAKGLSVPTERVWVHYQEMEPKEVWFGNQWAG